MLSKAIWSEDLYVDGKESKGSVQRNQMLTVRLVVYHWGLKEEEVKSLLMLSRKEKLFI